MRATRTSRKRVPDTPKWIKRKKALAAMREDMGAAPVGVVRRHYEVRCCGAIAMPSMCAFEMLKSHAPLLARCSWEVCLLLCAGAAGQLSLLATNSASEGVQGFPEIVRAENYIIDNNLGDVISQSFGATEETFPSPKAILDLRSAFKNAAAHKVTVLGASGDLGATDFELNL